MSLACDLNISIAKQGILKGISSKYVPEEYKNNNPDFTNDELQIPLKGKSKTEVTEIFEPILSTIEKDYKGNIKGQIVKNSASDPFYIKFNVNRDYIIDKLQLTVKNINDLQTTEIIDTKIVDPLLNVQRGLSDPLIRQKYFSEGETTTDKEILTKIANSSHPLNQLAKHLIKYAKGISVKLVPEIIAINPQTNEEKNSAGLYKQIDLFTEEIQINEFARFRGMGIEPTIIHEILHSLSVTWLNSINQKDPLYLEFKKYYSEALQNKELQSLNEDEGYGLTNEREFLVALFTDAKLINKLKEIPASEPTKYKNKLEEIFNFILSLFKIKENSSIYSEAFAVVSNIIEEQFDLNNKLIDNLNPYGTDLFENYNLEESFNSELENYKPSELKVSIENIIQLNNSFISSNIFELNPNITEEKIKNIYNNYEDLMNKQREGKAISFDIFKSLIKQYQVFNYKNTYIFGNYDINTGTFITRINSSPSSKELLTEAIPNIVNNGIDFISFVPKDYADKLIRSGYVSSINSFKYNFKGELMNKFAVASNNNVFNKIFNKNFNEITSEEIENFNDSIGLQYNAVEINSSLINQAGKDASKILETYLKQFGITVKDINIIKDTFNLDELGFVDLLSKIIYVKDKKDLPSFAGETIAYMMQYNSLVKEIINNLIQTNAILIPKNLYTLNEKGDKVYNYNKLNKTEFFKYIGKLISEDLNNKLEGNYDKSLVEKIKQLIKTFFDYITKSDIALINKNIGIITNNILQQNKKLVTSSLYKPGAYGKSVKQINIEDALKKDKFGESIIYKLSNEGFILTGSTALSEQGIILRPDENPLHDIDWISPFKREETTDKFLKIYPNAIKVRDIYGEDQVTDSYLIAPEGYKISDLKINEFNGKIIIDSYNILDKNNNIVGTYKLQKQLNSNQSEEIVTGIEGKVIDFFSYENFNNKNRNKPFIYKSLSGNIIQLANWKDIFKAKLEFARYKDIWDYNRFIPNENINLLTNINPNLIPDNIEEQFAEAKKLENKTPENNEEFNKKILYSLILPNISYDRFLNVFSQTNPQEFNKYRQEKVKKIIDSFAKKFNITIETINTFQDRYAIANNKSISYNGVANLANKTIKYLDGDNNALTEEVAHFMVAMLDKNGPEYSALKNYITQTEEYQLYYDSYLEVYNGDIDKTEEEIMGKVVANSLLGISEKAPLSLKSIIRQIFNKLKEFLTPQYKREFTKALDNINHLFFTENFDTAFNEANITFDEFYKLDFLNVENEIKFNKSTDQIINTITTNLERQKVKFIQNKQTDLVNKTTLLIKILNSEDPDIDNIEKIKDFISLSVLEIQNLKNSFEEFEKSGVIQDLESKDFSKLSRKEQEAQTNQDRLNNLNYIASAISTVQNLYSFIQLIEENFTSMNRDLQSLKDYKEIVESLPNTQENNSFKSALSFTYPAKKEAAISELKGVYENISKQLLKVVFNSLSTVEQKQFLEITKLDPMTNVVEAKDIKTEINIFSTIKDYFLGKFSDSKASTAYKTTKTNLMPVSFQSDIFLLSIDNANAAIRQIKLMNTTKETYEIDLLQTDLQVLGDFDQTFVSAKDKNGKVNFKLLQKYNYLQFGNTLTNKIVNSHLIPLIQLNSNVLKSEILKGTSKDLEKVFKKNIRSPKNLKLSISKLFENTVISKNLYYFLLNYVKAYELIYTLKLSQSNPNLSDINYQNLTQYQNEYIAQLENKLTNLKFTENKLPYLNINFDFQNSSLTELQIIDVVHNIVNNKREQIIKKEVTIPEMVNGNPNPVYYNQLGYAEGLLNFFKQKINFVENLEGDVNIDLINFITLGDELFFNLSDKNQISGIDYIDQDYIKLEKESKDTTNSRTQKIAETKLKIIKKIQDFNNKNNLKSNYLKKKFKYNNSQFLTDDLNKRNFLNYIFRIIPSAALSVGLSKGIYYAPIIYDFSLIGIDQLIKIAYFVRKNNFNVIKALQLYFNSSIKEELRVEDYDVGVKTNEEKSYFKTFKQIFTTLRNKIESIFLNNTDDSEVIDTNTFLVGETEIPKPFAKIKADNTQLSTDFIADYKTFVQEMANYETNVRWESWIRMAGEYQAIREGFNSLNVINLIKDRFFFNKFYNKNAFVNIIRILTNNFARKSLTGNISAQILNFSLGNLTTLIHTNPINFAKAFINNLRDVGNKLYSATNAKNLFDDFLNIFTGNNSEKNRLAFFQTLAETFLGKNRTLIQERNNLSTHIKKYLKNQRGTGFTVFDESENYLINITQSTNSQGLQQLVENFITTLLINSYFLDNPLVDKFNNPIKNLQTYLSLENGKIVLDKKKLGITEFYLKNDNKLKVKNYDNIDIENDKGFSEMTLEELNVNPLTNLELEIFLNETMLNEISNLQEKSQGVYNIFNKSYWRNTWLGLLLLQFRDHVLPSLTTTINSKKISINFTDYEKGIINSLSSIVSKTIKKDNFNKDSYQNALLLNNLDYRIMLRDNAIIKFFIKKTLNTNIDKKLKELAKDNVNYKKLVKKELTVNLLNNINKITYIQKFANKSNLDLEKNIKLYFNTNNNKKIEILKKLINDKFIDPKGTLNIKNLEELNKIEIQENYSEILENYNKLQNELSGDIKALNRLTNITLILGLLMLPALLCEVFKAIDDENEQEELKNYVCHDYLLILAENIVSNISANYMLISELAAYGYDTVTGKLDTNKALLSVGDIRRIYNSIDINWTSDKAVGTSDAKIKEREEILKLLKLNKQDVPLLKPILKTDQYGFKSIEDNIEFKESLLKLTIPKGVSDNFEIFKNKNDLERYEKQKDLNFLELLTLNAKTQKFAKFYGIYIDPDKQEELEKKLEESNKRIEALSEENENIENNNK